MAIIDKKGRLHGKLGRLNYRVLKNGTEVISTLPRRMRQTRATKESGLEFGLASSTAFYIRQAFSGLTHFADSGMINRLNSTVLRAIKESKTKIRGERDLHDGDLSELKGFQFNRNSPLSQWLPVRPECTLQKDKRIAVHIPAFNDLDLKRPVNGHMCSIQLILTVINFKAGYYETLGHVDFEVKWDSRIMQTFDWQPEAEIPAGCIALVSLSLNYACHNQNTGSFTAINSIDCNPAEMIGAFAIAPDTVDTPLQKRESSLLLQNYKGAELLARIDRLRQKDPAYQKLVAENGKNPVGLVVANDQPKGKVYFKKPEQDG